MEEGKWGVLIGSQARKGINWYSFLEIKFTEWVGGSCVYLFVPSVLQIIPHIHASRFSGTMYCSVIWGHLTDIVHLTGVSEVIDTFVPNDSCKVFRNVSLLYLFK